MRKGTCLTLAVLALMSPPPKLSEVKPMNEDKRVKAHAIDAVMADDNVFFLDVREPKEIEEGGSYGGYVNIPKLKPASQDGTTGSNRESVGYARDRLTVAQSYKRKEPADEGYSTRGLRCGLG
ncbi:MAG TPA: hypothetical protein VEQ84_01560, partial [Vicinamibacteria bacterium]|nr:hypothetical protein [Vicinamibacteria bacterium]